MRLWKKEKRNSPMNLQRTAEVTSVEDSKPAASAQGNFLQMFGDFSLNQLFADWHPQVVTADSDAWLDFPPDDFLQFARRFYTPFDGIPFSDAYLQPPTFLISQAHRIWKTASLVFSQLQGRNEGGLLDLGSFPFAIPLALREYFGYAGKIAVTTNVQMTDEQERFLAARQIQVFPLDLDPYVSDPNSAVARLPDAIPLPSASFDVILMSHVIEHLYHPSSIIRECARLMKGGGTLVITTDNAMMIDVLCNYVGGYGYTFEPIQSTAAMTYNFWRGHVRFFTGDDLTTLASAHGLHVEKVDYFHCFYDILFEDYFRNPQATLPGWKRQMLARVPWTRNDIAVIASKPM